MANVMNMANVKNKVSRNSFDLSYRNITSCCVGQLLPFFCKEVMPSDNVRLNTSWFTRTVPINTAAYTRIREHIDYFFVPYHLLWRFSEQVFTQLEGNYQHSISDTPSRKANSMNLPCFDEDIVERFLNQSLLINNMNNEKRNLLKDAGGNNRIVGTYRLLDALGYALQDTNSSQVFTPLNAFRILAYQKIYSDYYRFDQWEDSNPNNFNVDYFTPNSSPLSAFDNYSKYVDEQTLNSANVDIHNDTPFTLRYANYPKDMFTGMLPSPQYGGTAYVDVGSSSLSGTAILNLQNSALPSVGPKDVHVISQVNQEPNGRLAVTNGTSGTTDVRVGITLPETIKNTFDVLQLRQAQALQRWKEVTNAHKRSYKSQIEAHYGTNVSEVASDMVTYIGGADQTIDIGEVINNNLTGSTPQATIAGKGVSSGQGYIDYQVKNFHGIIMGIYHAVPILDYSSEAIDLFNLKTNGEDYAVPEFDKLGMQPLPFVAIDARNSTYQAYLRENGTSYLGYVPRYIEYKTSRDIVSASVRKSFVKWQTALDMDDFIADGSTPTIDYTSFKVKPKQLNNIFLVQNGNPTAQSFYDYSGDQLLINFNNSCQMVRPLDFNGLPY